QHHGPGAAAAAAAATGSAFTQRETTWASISGLTEVKILLQEATVLPTLRPDLFQGIRQPPKALLLFGPPGTGKTLLARAVAAESRASFFPVTGSSVLSMWYGQSEQNVKALFEKARRRQPAIIFIDEVDSLLGKRSSGGPRDSNPDRRVTNEFLAFIDGIQTRQGGTSGSGGPGVGGDEGDTRVVVIAATNAPWDLDEAALSRFSRRIYVPLPDKATREALMRAAMEGISCDVSGAEWRRLAERCEKYSGRDLVQVCREAAMRPLRDLWGRRLLEGTPPAADGDGTAAGPMSQQTAVAQQRLVDLVAKSLWASAPASASAGMCAPPSPPPPPSAGGAAKNAAAGRIRRFRLGFGWAGFGGDRYMQSKKQARRELERWKRRHGATWCDVGLIMQQAESVVEGRRRAGDGARDPDPATTTATSTTAAAATAAQAASHQEAMASAPSPFPASSPSGIHQSLDSYLSTGSTDNQQQQQQEQHCVQNQQKDTGVVEVCHQPAVNCAVRSGPLPMGTECSSRIVRLTVKVEAKAKSSALSVPSSAAAAVGDQGRSECGGDQEHECVKVRLEVEESGAAAAAAAAVREQRAEEGEGGKAGVKDAREAAAATTIAAEAAAAAGGADAVTSTSAMVVVQPAPSPSPSGCPAAAAAVAAKDDSGPAAALSLEGLLALPANQVRPVTAADLEAALQVISCTEMDQTARYTEWDEQYGSGAAGSGRQGYLRGKVWMSMYA
ncbi:hypothetical protein Vretifemale_16306, partial [Volvox reticuliferus]